MGHFSRSPSNVRIRHRVSPDWSPDRNDPEWSERVEREAGITTDQAQRRYEKALERVERAKGRLAREESARRPSRARIRSAREEVERRRQELVALSAVMNTSPAGSQNRGKGSYRGVPSTQPL